jgi:hypothetical protein
MPVLSARNQISRTSQRTPRYGSRLLRCGIAIRHMSGSGQERRIGAVRNISALPPRADGGADIVEPPVSARNGLMHRSKRRAYSITSSAVESRVGGTVRPSILAVWVSMISSSLVACTTGRSAGLAPLRIRLT